MSCGAEEQREARDLPALYLVEQSAAINRDAS